MSAIASGDWVFVHPQDECAPREVRGRAGVVETVLDHRATVSFRVGDGSFVLELELAMLKPDRRRRDRPAAAWSPLAAAAS